MPIGLGVPSRVLGAKVAAAGLAPADELRAVTSLNELQGIYLVGLVPFLLGTLLVPAACSTPPASRPWWIDSAITVGAYAWLAAGALRHRPATGPDGGLGSAVPGREPGW